MVQVNTQTLRDCMDAGFDVLDSCRIFEISNTASEQTALSKPERGVGQRVHQAALFKIVNPKSKPLCIPIHLLLTRN